MRTSIAAVAAATMIVAGASAEAAAVYADAVYIDVEANANQNTSDSQRFGPDNALGAADGDFYSLGRHSAAVFTFGGDIVGPGTVFEVTFNCSGTTSTGLCSHYPETADLFGVVGPIDFASLVDGNVAGVTNYDFSSLTLEFIASVPNGAAQGGFAFSTNGNTYSALFIRDTSTINGDGFDVAAISATPAPVPLPPAAALLFGALGGLGLAKRRRA